MTLEINRYLVYFLKSKLKSYLFSTLLVELIKLLVDFSSCPCSGANSFGKPFIFLDVFLVHSLKQTKKYFVHNNRFKTTGHK